MTLTKTQRQIVETIRLIYRRGEPLNITAVKRLHPELMEAVYAVKPFWGWKRALEAAEIVYSKIKVELQDYCECEICRAIKRNLGAHLWKKHGIDGDDYRIDYPGAALICETLRAQSKILPPWEPLWSPEYVLDELWDMHRKRLPMNSDAVLSRSPCLSRHIPPLLESFDNALKRLGLNPEDIRISRAPMKTKKEVLDAIAKRRRLHLSLHARDLLTGRNSNCALLMSAQRLFGSWRRTLEAIGVDYVAFTSRSRYPTPQKVRCEIRRRHQRGLPLGSVEIRHGKYADTALYKKALESFGLWNKAYTAAGLVYKPTPKGRPRKFPTKESVVAEIRRRQKAGISIRANDVHLSLCADIALYNSARLFFGQWNRAVEYAGFSYEEIVPQCPYSTPQAVLDEIRCRYRKGRPLNISRVAQGERHERSLYAKGRRVFGSWKMAVEAAGIRYGDVALINRTKGHNRSNKVYLSPGRTPRNRTLQG